MNSFFVYRLPGEGGIKAYMASMTISGIAEGGFTISPFNTTPEHILTIPAETPVSLEFISAEWRNNVDVETLFPYPALSTSRFDHGCEIKRIMEFIGNDSRKKVVAARVSLEKESIDLTQFFNLLCKRYPSAFVFLFFTPQSGCWIGASPELLLAKRGNRLFTVALAGTRRAASPGPWDQKNIEEQRVVAEYICGVLDNHGIGAECSDPFTAEAGPVEHIKNEITGIISSENNLSMITDLLLDLSPTPALCGFPKKEALAIISENEVFSRAFYGGFCGPVDKVGDFSFFVNLRSMWVRHEDYAIFTGGGITRFSDSESEWMETEKKKETLLF